MRHGNDSAPGVAIRFSVHGQLLKMYPAGCQGCFLVQFAVGGIQNFLAIVVQESSGQGGHASEGGFAPLHHQHVEAALPQRQDHEIDRQ
ncbi:hypothetical protein F750_4517 [Streptomyces sp. PAMC 26508]|nr:hypothetical protein F750_4517 [Streptomyces sp. PAMC 26508]